MAHAGEQQFPVLLHAGEVLHHDVEGFVHLTDFGRAGVRELFRRLPAAQRLRGAREIRERLHRVTREERGAERREHKGDDAPPEPGRAARAVKELFPRHQPVLIAVNRERHPEAFFSVHFGGEHRVRPKPLMHHLLDETHG